MFFDNLNINVVLSWFLPKTHAKTESILVFYNGFHPSLQILHSSGVFFDKLKPIF